MSMIEVKTSELIGPALDWAVDWVVSGKPLDVLQKKNGSGEWAYFHEGNWFAPGPRKYSTDWSQGGPLIERFGCDLSCIAPGNRWEANCWGCDLPTPGLHLHEAETPLVAAMRAIVASKLGDAVSVPAELVQQQGEGDS